MALSLGDRVALHIDGYPTPDYYVLPMPPSAAFGVRSDGSTGVLWDNGIESDVDDGDLDLVTASSVDRNARVVQIVSPFEPSVFSVEPVPDYIGQVIASYTRSLSSDRVPFGTFLLVKLLGSDEFVEVLEDYTVDVVGR